MCVPAKLFGRVDPGGNLRVFGDDHVLGRDGSLTVAVGGRRGTMGEP